MKHFFSRALLLSLFVSLAYASELEPKTHQDDQRILSLRKPVQDISSITPAVPVPIVPKADTAIVLDADELAKQPELIVWALSSALLQNQADDVAYLLPFYQKLPSTMREPLIEHWAMAMTAQQRGDYERAITTYRAIVADYPQVLMVRLSLAMSLFVNKNYKDAKQAFLALKQTSEPIPEPIHALIETYLSAIDKQSDWSFYVGGNFLNDKNINNAPAKQELGGGWIAPKAQSAHGLALSASASKFEPLADGFYVDGKISTQGKYYWDNKGYNELTLKVATGIGHQNARHQLNLSPFVEKSYYADGRDTGRLKHFSATHGLMAQWSYWLAPKWQTSLYGEVGKQRYDTRVHLNGLTRHGNWLMTYVPNASRHLFFGLDYQQVRARDGDDSFTKKGLRAGISQMWQHGLGVRASVNYAQKRYDAPNFFGKIQHNHEYGLSASIYHQKLQLANTMPRLTWQYQKVDSNLPLYQYDKNQVFVELVKQF